MRKRLCGREQEFGIRISPAPKLKKQRWGVVVHPYQYIAEAILAELGRKYESIGVCELRDNEEGDDFYESLDDFWLANGSRLYIDQGILETALPEHQPCTLDSVLYERASEMMLNTAIAAFRRKNSRYKSVSLYKNNISYDTGDGIVTENTYGSHQNYSCRKRSVRKISMILRNFLPAALPLTGSGHILYRGLKADYCFSQRAEHINSVSSVNTLTDRPLVNTRGFEGADTLMSDDSMARVHLISCDATRCEFQTWLVEGIMHLIMRLAEEGWDLPKNARLADPVRSNKDFNLSFSMDYRLAMSSGREIPVLDYLGIYLDGAKQLKPLSDGERKCLREWENILNLLEDSEGRGLVGKLDWATKFQLLKNQMKKHQFDLNDGRALSINMEYHNISADPNQSWFARLQELGYLTRLSDDKLVERAIITAPMTRAYARGKFIRRCLQTRGWRKKIGGISWSGAFWNKLPVTFGRDGDPFSTELV